MDFLNDQFPHWIPIWLPHDSHAWLPLWPCSDGFTNSYPQEYYMALSQTSRSIISKGNRKVHLLTLESSRSLQVSFSKPSWSQTPQSKHVMKTPHFQTQGKLSIFLKIWSKIPFSNHMVISSYFQSRITK